MRFSTDYSRGGGELVFHHDLISNPPKKPLSDTVFFFNYHHHHLLLLLLEHYHQLLLLLHHHQFFINLLLLHHHHHHILLFLLLHHHHHLLLHHHHHMVPRKDPGWEHGDPILGKTNAFICKYCGFKKNRGGITRLKEHVAGVGSEVIKCQKAPKAARDHCLELISAGKVVRVMKKNVQREIDAQITREDFCTDQETEAEHMRRLSQNEAAVVWEREQQRRWEEERDPNSEPGGGSAAAQQRPMSSSQPNRGVFGRFFRSTSTRQTDPDLFATESKQQRVDDMINN